MSGQLPHGRGSVVAVNTRTRFATASASGFPSFSQSARTQKLDLPPLTAATIEISAPSAIAVPSPPVYLICSLPTNTLTCSRTSPCSVSTRSRTPGYSTHSASSASRTVATRGGPPIGERTQRSRYVERDRHQRRLPRCTGFFFFVVRAGAAFRATRGSPKTAVFTHTIDGTPSRIRFQFFPSSIDPYSTPLRVPK
jgi:hypothetical protein